MENLTMDDVIIHFDNRIRERSEEISNTISDLNKNKGIAEGSWAGRGATAYEIKIDEISASLKTIKELLADISRKLKCINEAEEEVSDSKNDL